MFWLRKTSILYSLYCSKKVGILGLNPREVYETTNPYIAILKHFEHKRELLHSSTFSNELETGKSKDLGISREESLQRCRNWYKRFQQFLAYRYSQHGMCRYYKKLQKCSRDRQNTKLPP